VERQVAVAPGRVVELLQPRRGLLRLDLRIGPLRSDDPRLRMLLAHLGALAAAPVILALQRSEAMSVGKMLTAIVIGLGLSLLRVLSVRRRLALSSLMLDAVGMVTLLAGTGATASPFYVLALAGVWWAAHVPRRRSGLTYGLAFAAAYALLIVPQALREHALTAAFDNAVALIIVALLSGWFVRVDRRALELSEAPHAPPVAAEQGAVRDSLLLPLRTTEIPVDVLLAARGIGLTVIQAELLISDGKPISDTAVRNRLTRVHREIGPRKEERGSTPRMNL
jgi:PAS domain-containing protein